MTTLTATPVTARRVTSLSAVNAERIKFLTLPSYTISALATLALLIGLGVLSSFAMVWQAEDGGPALGSVVPGLVLDGVQTAQVLLAIVATLFVTSEYAQGTIQTSVIAVPKRIPILLAKAATVASAGLLIGVAGSATLMFAAPAILDQAGIGVDWSAQTPVQVILGCGLYLALIAVLALSLGVLIRNTVGAFLTVVALLTVAPLLLSAVPIEWVAKATLYLPTIAGILVLYPDSPMSPLTPWQGLGVLAAWATAGMVAAALTLRFRDA